MAHGGPLFFDIGERLTFSAGTNNPYLGAQSKYLRSVHEQKQDAHNQLI